MFIIFFRCAMIVLEWRSVILFTSDRCRNRIRFFHFLCAPLAHQSKSGPILMKYRLCYFGLARRSVPFFEARQVVPISETQRNGHSKGAFDGNPILLTASKGCTLGFTHTHCHEMRRHRRGGGKL